MGLKESRRGRAAAAVVETEPETEETVQETQYPVAVENEAGAEADTGAGTPRKRGRKPGQSQNRGPQLEWTYEREAALARVLKAPKALGDIRTARSVAEALALDPAFENEPLLTPEAVKSWVDLIKARLTDQGRDIPSYLNFDRLRRRNPTLSLFDEDGGEDETGDGAGDATEGEEETED